MSVQRMGSVYMHTGISQKPVTLNNASDYRANGLIVNGLRLGLGLGVR